MNVGRGYIIKEWKRLCNPEQSVSQGVTKVGIELLGQLEISIKETMPQTFKCHIKLLLLTMFAFLAPPGALVVMVGYPTLLYVPLEMQNKLYKFSLSPHHISRTFLSNHYNMCSVQLRITQGNSHNATQCNKQGLQGSVHPNRKIQYTND